MRDQRGEVRLGSIYIKVERAGSSKSKLNIGYRGVVGGGGASEIITSYSLNYKKSWA